MLQAAEPASIVDNNDKWEAGLETDAGKVGSGYRRYGLALLMVVLTFNFLDRQIVNILAEQIKTDLGISDAQIGLMTGFAFAVLYTVLGLPIARWAERGDRVVIISVALAVWSGFTVACGFAQSFLQLLLARVGVGVGEAGCTPPSHSLISDYAPREKRASALAFYSLGIPLGSLAGLAVGGVAADLYGWRVAFVLAGAPGLLLALVVLFTLREPRRTQTPAAVRDSAAPISGRDAWAALRRSRTFWWMSGGAATMGFLGYGHLAFYGSFYFRNHAEALAALVPAGSDLGPAAVLGLSLGVLVGLCGLAGTFLGGQIADWGAKRDVRIYMTLPAVAVLLGAPFFLAAASVKDLGLSFLLLTVPLTLNSLWYGPVYASAQSLVPPQCRATASAVLLFIINLVGLGLGPLAVGLLSDGFATTMGLAEGLRWALITTAAAGLVAAACFLVARRSIRHEMVS
ncbi:spinster family MFS transporter [Brevundimonas aurifodinae]|uniref:MFS transporter n=1 Tax=Brevundimonas aurifodinae TaxID=1508312 RepID=A0ABV1NL41_9CAUL